MDYNLKAVLVDLSGKCFWYWQSYYSFLESCGVPSSFYLKFDKENGKYNLMRNVLDSLERQERQEIIDNIVSGFYRLKIRESDVKDLRLAQNLLNEFRNLVGQDPIEKAIEDKKAKEKISIYKKVNEEKQLRERLKESMKQKFQELHLAENRQKAGYELEKLFYDLLDLEEYENTRPFKTKGEQIDGHFKHEKFDYLVEIKWEKHPATQADLSILDGKIKGKAQSTRAVIFSVAGFNNNAVDKFSGDSPRIIFIDGADFFSVLNGSYTFYDLMRKKVDSLVRTGNVFLKVSEF